MTSKPIDQNQIIAEINLIPEDKRLELYELIHQFRMGLNQPKHNQNEIMQFAGSWLDMPEEDFSELYEEMEQRGFNVKNISVKSKYYNCTDWML